MFLLICLYRECVSECGWVDVFMCLCLCVCVYRATTQVKIMMEGISLFSWNWRKLHFVWMCAYVCECVSVLVCVENYAIRNFAILVMSISINFVFPSVFHRPSPVIIVIQFHIAFLFLLLAMCLPIIVAKKCAARNNGKTLCAWTLFDIPFDLHELIKTIVQRNERPNCDAEKNRKKSEEQNKTPLRQVDVIKNRVAPKFHASANFHHLSKLRLTIHFHMRTKENGKTTNWIESWGNGKR